MMRLELIPGGGSGSSRDEGSNYCYRGYITLASWRGHQHWLPQIQYICASMRPWVSCASLRAQSMRFPNWTYRNREIGQSYCVCRLEGSATQRELSQAGKANCRSPSVGISRYDYTLERTAGRGTNFQNATATMLMYMMSPNFVCSGNADPQALSIPVTESSASSEHGSGGEVVIDRGERAIERIFRRRQEGQSWPPFPDYELKRLRSSPCW